MIKPVSKKTVFTPLFGRLERDIVSGRYEEGALMPAEKDLARQFRVSRYAAREAYSELVRRRLVKRIKRKGTVVIYDGLPAGLSRIGLVLVSDVPAFFIFLRGVESVLGERGASPQVHYHYNQESTCRQMLQDLSDGSVQGLIVAPPAHSSMEPYRELVRKKFPVVMVLSSCPGVPSVYPDDHQAGLLIGDHFGQMGFRRPALVTDDSAYARVREYGYREGLARHGLTLAEDRRVSLYYADDQGRLHSDPGRREVETLLHQDPHPDAAFVVNDAAAAGVYYWLLKSGLRVPADIAVAGVDNLGPRIHPFQLTTVDIGLEEIGRRAAALLLEQIRNPDLPPSHHRIKPRLLVSGSTRRSESGAG